MGEVFHESTPLNDNYIKKDFLGVILSISLKHYQKSSEIQFFRIENTGVLRKKEILYNISCKEIFVKKYNISCKDNYTIQKDF